MIVLWGVMLVVIAAVFFWLWLVAHSRLSKPTIAIIEPFDLVKSWHVARFDGQGSQVEAALKVLAATKKGEAMLDGILPAVKGKVPKAALLDHRELSLLGEQKLVEEGSKKFSYVAGLAAEIIPQLLLSAAEKKELLTLEANAGEHGFLALFVGRTAVHGLAKLEGLEHVYLGAVLLEPAIIQKALPQITALPAPKKVLTVLPATFAEHLAEKVGITGPAYTPSSNDSAERFDQKVLSATIIAGANADSRYRAIRTLEHDYRCQNWL